MNRMLLCIHASQLLLPELAESRFRSRPGDRVACCFLVQRLHRAACANYLAKPMALELDHGHPYQYVVSWLHPFHRHRVTMFRRTGDPQRTVRTRGPNHVDFTASDNFATNQAVTFLIQRAPLPKVV